MSPTTLKIIGLVILLSIVIFEQMLIGKVSLTNLKNESLKRDTSKEGYLISKRPQPFFLIQLVPL